MKKYGIDTNVMIRHLVQDDRKQSQKATRFLSKNCTVENPGNVSIIVLCEMVWVLRKSYGYSKSDIVRALQVLLSAAEFTIESPTIVWESLRQFQKGSADFADYIIGRINRSAGCITTVTFDKSLANSPHFQIL